MREIRAVLCDDDSAWLAQGERILCDYADQSGFSLHLASFTDGENLFIDCDSPPDVLFCDIELADDKNGIDLVRVVTSTWPLCQIVYVTNYLRYAPDVYTTEHLWFVTKARFKECLPEVMDKLNRKLDDGARALSLRTTEGEDLRLPCLAIVCMERRGRKTIITQSDGTTHTVRERLPELLYGCQGACSCIATGALPSILSTCGFCAGLRPSWLVGLRCP